MKIGVDILENDIIKLYPGVIDIILQDQGTEKNIIWGTNNYEHLGDSYNHNTLILPELITGKNGNLIMPRIEKDKTLQLSRSKNMAEVFTPSWVCNSQNNMIDDRWFDRKNVFNYEVEDVDGLPWKVNIQKVYFPENRTWKDYINDKRLEIACGEAPYLTSRYDTTTGEFIPVSSRVGIIDRKLRIINENIENHDEWLDATQVAYESCYGYEWQGDNLLLAREAMLITFLENHILKFNKEPSLESIKNIAHIISWNIWQMDGLKGVVPYTCTTESLSTTDLFGHNETKDYFCTGCKKDQITKHNGVYCEVMDWSKIDKQTGKKGEKFRFIDLIK